MSDQNSQEALRLMGDTATWAAAMTGIKKQLVDQGWSEAAAEQMVIALMMKQGVTA